MSLNAKTSGSGTILKRMKHRHDRLLDSVRDMTSSAVKRGILFFAEGCVDSLININDAIKDAKSEEDYLLEQDINKLLADLGIREESKE